MNKKLAEAVSKKDYALAATLQEELVEMEEHAAQKMNTLKVLNANLDEALAKKDYMGPNFENVETKFEPLKFGLSTKENAKMSDTKTTVFTSIAIILGALALFIGLLPINGQ